MVCTDNPHIYETVRMMRSHGMVRESTSEQVKESYRKQYPDLNPDFIFAFPAYNVRSTEINAVLGRSQLRRLDANNRIRTRNLKLFLEGLDPSKYRTDFEIEGSCNYAFTLVLKHADAALSGKVEQMMRGAGVEFRRGTSGGGSQLRQPYARKLIGDREFEKYPAVDHVHFHGYYIGNYPDLDTKKISALCAMLNHIE
jgi:CDP-4-dehydro-6-deoxyglucose reductase, E1